MKKRLRKKKRLGEFREMGFAVAIKWTSPTMDWALIDGCIEPAGLGYGGGGRDGQDFGFISRYRKGCTEADREHVRGWLETCPSVSAFVIGPLVDAWHISGSEVETMYASLDERLEGLIQWVDKCIAAS